MRQPLNVEGTRVQGSTFKNADLSGSTFRDVNLSGCTFDNVNLGNCTINNVSLGASKISNSCFTELQIDGNTTDMVINGVPLKDMVEAWQKQKDKDSR